jgi:hypothetical protein
LSQPSAVEMSAPDDPGDLTSIGRFSRTPQAIADIRLIVQLERSEWAAAFAERAEHAQGYRTTEALVYFILQAVAANDDRAINALFKQLRDRCTIMMRSWIRGVDNEEDRLDIQGRVIEQMTRRLVQGGPACDFLQARFWRYLQLRTLSAIDELKKLHRDSLLDDLAAEDDDDSMVDQVRERRLSPEERLLIKDALRALPPELRETYVLRHYAGWRVGDERKQDTDPNDPTLMEHFSLSRRAIDKRLAKAEVLLERYRKDPA